MSHYSKDDSGQISILILVISFVLLGGTIVISAIAQVQISQQRLNSKADSIALAGASEIEFNSARACEVAEAFSLTSYGLEAKCETHPAFIEIEISVSNPNRFFGVIMPNIYATSRAGIANDK